MKLTWKNKKTGEEFEVETRRTAGRRRCMNHDRFRGPGLGKHSYTNGVNPTRATNSGRAS